MNDQLIVTVIGALSGAVATLAAALAWLGKKVLNIMEKNTTVMQELVSLIRGQEDEHARQKEAHDSIKAVCYDIQSMIKYKNK